MLFAGLPFATLAAIAAIAGGLTVVFYILKLRRRPIAVPFSPIWERILKDKDATSWFSRLKRLLSLLFQLALLTLLLAALGDPRLSQNFIEGRNILVLVDTSASMKATDESPTRLEAASREVARLVRGLGGTDRMLIASMDFGVRPLTSMTSDTSELELSLKELKATDTRADLKRALRFSLDALSGLNKPEIILVSDGAFGDLTELRKSVSLGGTKLSYIPVGKSNRNVAITQFSARRYPLDKSRHEVMLELTNTNDEAALVELSLLGDGEVIDISRLSLGPGESLPRFYKDLAGASRTLEARVRFADGAEDDLPADNHAYAVMPERTRAKVLLVTQTNTYLEAALLLDEYLEVTSVEPKAYPPAGKFDVTIFDSVAPSASEGSGSLLYINPPDVPELPVKRGKAIKGFGFDLWDRKHPITRWMELGDVQVAQGFIFRPEKEHRVVGSSFEGALLVEGQTGGKRWLALSFDPRDSDFVMRVAWPLFVLNSINYFVEENTDYISSFRTGEVWYIPTSNAAETAELEGPDKVRRVVPIKAGRAVYQGDQAGFYTLRTQVGADTQSTLFAANLVDLEESQITPEPELKIEAEAAQAATGFNAGVRDELWLYLLLAAIIASCVEWFTYHRRVTV